jgi:hypothetical protein
VHGEERHECQIASVGPPACQTAGERERDREQEHGAEQREHGRSASAFPEAVLREDGPRSRADERERDPGAAGSQQKPENRLVHGSPELFARGSGRAAENIAIRRRG